MYLLDTSVVSDIVNASSSRHKAAVQFIQDNRLFEDQIYISLVTIAEMKFGREVFSLRTPPPKPNDLVLLDEKILSAEKFTTTLEISRHVASDYAKLRAAYAKGIAPNLINNGKLKSLPPERWAGQSLSAGQLQITENDLWIAATAITYDFELVTCDKDYKRVGEHFKKLRVLMI